MKLSSATGALLATALVTSSAGLLPAATAQAATVTATLVKTTWTGGPNSNWAEPSPDPSGITYNSRTGRLMIVDGEVEETGAAYPKNVWRGTNLYVAGLNGALLGYDTNTLAYSAEPVGVGFRPASSGFPEALFISDDNLDRVFEVHPGGDGTYGTADDPQTSFSTRFTGVRADDPEDVAVDLEMTRNGQLLIIDGYHKEVYVYSPGANKKFDGLPSAGGDDTVRQFDVELHGARDPEGIAYNPSRNTIFVLDDPSNQILEFGLQGGPPQNLIKLPFTMTSGAGIALAPPSGNSSGACNAYIVDRGVDNDTNQDTFNDGRLYEVAIPGLTGSGGTGSAPCSSGGGGGGGTNTAPTVDAGANQTVVQPNAATLDGTVTDDGQVNATPTTTWTKASGPGTVAFTNANAVDTTATFSAVGDYVLRLTADDGGLSASDTTTVTVTDAPDEGGTGDAVDIPVRASTDDAEQKPSGSMALASGDLNLTKDDSATMTVGMRFTSVPVPQGATITNAYVQFTADEAQSVATDLTIRAETANAATFTSTSGNITSRSLTTQNVRWQPAAWTAGAKTTAQRTPNLATVLQPVVSGSGWASGQALALVITGTGERTAESYNGGAAKAPVLHIEYGGGGGGGGGTPTDQPPSVNAGSDASVVLPNPANLDGTVTDPEGATVTSTWSEASGPGTVTFGNASAQDTTATFSEAGTYVLRLTGSDGTNTASDDVTITVSASSGGGGGGAGMLDIPVRVSSDDAEERPSGSIQLASGDLNLGQEDSYLQTVGMRFTGVTIPNGATITKAYVTFVADEIKTATSTLTIAGQDSDNPAAFTTASKSISTRPKTTANVSWSPGGWTTTGVKHQSADISAVVQEIVNRTDWASGEALVLLVTGTGERAAESFDGGSAKAPVLHIEFTAP